VAGEALEGLIAAIRKHYEQENPPPLLLSSFGQRNKELVTALKQEFGSLKAAVKAAGENQIRFVDLKVGSEAVAPTDIAAQVQHQIQEATASQRNGANNFDSLPFPVKLAFCVRTDAGEHIAIDTTRPFRFTKVTAPDLIRPSQRLVPEAYRRPGTSLRTASVQDRESLWRQFLAWTEETGVDPATFDQGVNTNALARLIAAQPKDVISRLVIPADIAEILLKHS
jgi:hypothetical protein